LWWADSPPITTLILSRQWMPGSAFFEVPIYLLMGFVGGAVRCGDVNIFVETDN
jgi:hypothetical protein